MTYLLDSSALLAFHFGEPGGERVRELLSDDANEVRLSALTMAEFWSRLQPVGAVETFEDELQQLRVMVTSVDPVTVDVVHRSLELRSAATGRLPQIDALIAATASVHAAVLVHRDPHLRSIPDHLLPQEVLPEK